ncbi:MAG: DUF3987 domain-containing protein [Desulfatibacillaceae bacterium]|nr:DUF3987 domain-containing protein [Desulfatibacillaceae bacterium]
MSNYQPFSDPCQQFLSFVRDLTGGFAPESIVPDGNKIRFATSDKRADLAGEARLFETDGFFAGYAKDYRTGAFSTWNSYEGNGHKALSDADRKKIAQAKERAAQARMDSENEAAQKAKELWDAASPAPENHSYLLKKRVRPYIARANEKGALLLPVYGPDGGLQSLQTILPDGGKLFLPGGKITGGFLCLEGSDTGGPVYLCEGYATAGTVFEALEGKSTVFAAFNAGNLLEVAKNIRAKNPARPIVICADNDAHLEGKPQGNIGKIKALEAAKATGAVVALPNFDHANEPGTDWNDFACSFENIETGLAAVQIQIQTCLDPQQPEPWPEPVAFGDIDAGNLDPELLPEPLRGFVNAVAESVQVPVELAICGGLGVLAAAAQGRFEVHVRGDHTEPLNLYLLAALDPGTRKSGCLAQFKRPLQTWENAMALLFAPEIKEAESRIKTLQKAIEKARSKACDLATAKEAQEAVKEIEAELDGIQVPVSPRLLLDDATSEAIAAFLCRYDERGAALEAEGGLFEVLSGLYSSGRFNLNLVLKAWSAEGVTVDRRSGPTLFLQAPTLTLCLTPQPEVLKDIAGKPGFRGKGLLARFLYFMPKSGLGYRDMTPAPIPEPTKEKWAAAIYEILERPCAIDEQGTKKPDRISLSEGALDLWLDFAGRIENELREGGLFEHLRDWAGKLPGQAIRLAGLFHVLTEANPAAVPISQSTMGAALELAINLCDHAQAAFAFMGTDPATECGQKILKWIQAERLETFTARDCYQAVKGTYARMKDVWPGLQALEERHFIRKLEEPNRAGAGRKPSPVFTVNPYAHNSQNPHN